MNKYLIVALWLAVVAVAGTGCAKKDKAAKASSKNAAFSPAVTEITPAPAYAAAPAFEPAAPVSTFTPSPAAPAPQQLAGAGQTYTVKRGDTLFGIARTHYGDGKQWSRIASANPGVSPQTLKAGQTITLP